MAEAGPRWASRERGVWWWWRGGAGALGLALDAVTLPLEGIYRGVVGYRNARFDAGHGVARARVPVLSVGNLTVGGTGKTPITRWLVTALLEAGRHPAVVLRGYGTDEAALHRRWYPAVPVVTAPERARGAREAEREGADVVVLDDGLQHRRLARDFDLVLLSAEQHDAVERGRVLPRGPLREPACGLARADAVVVTTRGADPEAALTFARLHAPSTPRFVARLRAAGWSDPSGGPGSAPGGPAVVVSAIGDPRGLLSTCESVGVEVVDQRSFPDHHAYADRDIADIEDWAAGRPIVTTEKDAVKLAGRVRRDWHVLTLAVDFGAERASLLALIEARLP